MNDYSINRFFYIIDYKINEGSRYCWSCYGPDSWCLSNGKGSFYSSFYDIDVVFDRKTLIIYEVTINENEPDVHYRWIHPNYRENYEQEAKERGVAPNIVYDDVKFTDVSSFEEWESKAREIINKYERY